MLVSTENPILYPRQGPLSFIKIYETFKTPNGGKWNRDHPTVGPNLVQSLRANQLLSQIIWTRKRDAFIKRQAPKRRASNGLTDLVQDLMLTNYLLNLTWPYWNPGKIILLKLCKKPFIWYTMPVHIAWCRPSTNINADDISKDCLDISLLFHIVWILHDSYV